MLVTLGIVCIIPGTLEAKTSPVCAGPEGSLCYSIDDNGWLFKSLSAGASWFPIGQLNPNFKGATIHPISESRTVLLAAWQTIFRSIDGGGTWQQEKAISEPVDRLFAITVPEPLLVAFAHGPKFWVSRSEGTEWTAISLNGAKGPPALLAGVELDVGKRGPRKPLKTVFYLVTGDGKAFRSNRLESGWKLSDLRTYKRDASIGKTVLRVSTRGCEHGCSSVAPAAGSACASKRVLSPVLGIEGHAKVDGTKVEYRISEQGFEKFTGSSWVKLETPRPVTSVAALDSSRVFAGTPEGILFSGDEGWSWNPLAGLREDAIVSLVAIPSAGRLIAGTAARIATSADNGNSWAPAVDIGGNPLGSLSVVSIVRLISDGPLWALTSKGLFVSADDGQHWKPVAEPMLGMVVHHLIQHGPSGLVASTDRGVFVSDDAGVTWRSVNDGIHDLVCEEPLPIRRCSLVVHGPAFGGVLHEEQVEPFDQVLCEGFDGSAFRSIGTRWMWSMVNRGAGFDSTVVGLVAQGGAGRLLAVTKDRAFESYDNGRTWFHDKAGLNAVSVFQNVDPDGASECWFHRFDIVPGKSSVLAMARGGRGDGWTTRPARRVVLQSENGFDNWTVIFGDMPDNDEPPTGPWFWVDSSKSEMRMAVRGWQADLERSGDGGATWRPMVSGMEDTEARAFAVSPVDNKVAFTVAETKWNSWTGSAPVLYRTDDGAWSWKLVREFDWRMNEVHLFAHPRRDIFLLSGNRTCEDINPACERDCRCECDAAMFAFGASGDLRELTPYPTHFVLEGWRSSRSCGGNLDGFVVPTAVGFWLEDDRQFAIGTTGANVFVTRDGGSTWLGGPICPTCKRDSKFLVRTLTFDPADPQRIWAGTTSGLWWTFDGGKTWWRAGESPE